MENRKRNVHDRDEVEDESRQKQMIAELDSQFKKFTDRCVCVCVCVCVCLYQRARMHVCVCPWHRYLPNRALLGPIGEVYKTVSRTRRHGAQLSLLLMDWAFD